MSLKHQMKIPLSEMIIQGQGRVQAKCRRSMKTVVPRAFRKRERKD